VKKILFIEDDPEWQEIMKELMQTAGHETIRANSHTDAIKLLTNNEHFNAILFDLKLGLTPINDRPFMWLDALVQGLNERNIDLCPIIIITSASLSKNQVREAFTRFRGIVFDLFDKNPKTKTFDSLEALLQSINEATKYELQKKPPSFWHLLINSLLMTGIITASIGILLWAVTQIADAKTQQTFIQWGGAIIVVFVLFLIITGQYAKLEDIFRAWKNK
jgi:CheY-like chemotaxis protein